MLFIFRNFPHKSQYLWSSQGVLINFLYNLKTNVCKYHRIYHLQRMHKNSFAGFQKCRGGINWDKSQSPPCILHGHFKNNQSNLKLLIIIGINPNLSINNLLEKTFSLNANKCRMQNPHKINCSGDFSFLGFKNCSVLSILH